MRRHTVLIIGAGSGIARACAEVWARQGAGLILVGRRVEDLQRTAYDLTLRFQIPVEVLPWDAENPASTLVLIRALSSVDPVQTVLIAHGWMADQADVSAHPELGRRMVDINLTAVIDLAERLVPLLSTDGTSAIGIISSVAGDRGRQSNYVYGACKAGLTAYADGLRNRLFHQQIHVVTIKPGFVATPMTAGKLKVGSPLVATPEQVAIEIVSAIAARRNTLYTRWYWRLIMTFITSIPEPIFKRLRL